MQATVRARVIGSSTSSVRYWLNQAALPFVGGWDAKVRADIATPGESFETLLLLT